MHDLFNLQGQVALITGASRGLGNHSALALAAKGVDLIITYRSQADAAAAVVASSTRAPGAMRLLAASSSPLGRLPMAKTATEAISAPVAARARIVK